MHEELFNEILSEKEYTNLELLVMPPLALAYVGDAVFEVFIREQLIREGSRQVNILHKKSISYVKANAQARIIHGINDFLTEDEQNIVRRGRNANSHSVPKNADVGEYRYATGFEALLGFIFLKGDSKRLTSLMNEAYKFISKENENGKGTKWLL